MSDLTSHVEKTLFRMAERDAAAHLTVASSDLCLRVDTRLVPCPWCGDKGTDTAGRRPAVPLFGWEFGWDWAPESHGRPILRALGCEIVTARSLLALAATVSRVTGLRESVFRTRAVTVADAGLGPGDDDALSKIVELVDRAESWIDLVGQAESPEHPDGLTLPIATRCQFPGGSGVPEMIQHFRASVQPRFLNPHLNSPAALALNDLYMERRLDIVAQGLGFRPR